MADATMSDASLVYSNALSEAMERITIASWQARESPEVWATHLINELASMQLQSQLHNSRPLAAVLLKHICAGEIPSPLFLVYIRHGICSAPSVLTMADLFKQFPLCFPAEDVVNDKRREVVCSVISIIADLVSDDWLLRLPSAGSSSLGTTNASFVDLPVASETHRSIEEAEHASNVVAGLLWLIQLLLSLLSRIASTKLEIKNNDCGDCFILDMALTSLRALVGINSARRTRTLLRCVLTEEQRDNLINLLKKLRSGAIAASEEMSYKNIHDDDDLCRAAADVSSALINVIRGAGDENWMMNMSLPLVSIPLLVRASVVSRVVIENAPVRFAGDMLGLNRAYGIPLNTIYVEVWGACLAALDTPIPDHDKDSIIHWRAFTYVTVPLSINHILNDVLLNSGDELNTAEKSIISLLSLAPEHLGSSPVASVADIISACIAHNIVRESAIRTAVGENLWPDAVNTPERNDNGTSFSWVPSDNAVDIAVQLSKELLPPDLPIGAARWSSIAETIAATAESLTKTLRPSDIELTRLSVFLRFITRDESNVMECLLSCGRLSRVARVLLSALDVLMFTPSSYENGIDGSGLMLQCMFLAVVRIDQLFDIKSLLKESCDKGQVFAQWIMSGGFSQTVYSIDSNHSGSGLDRLNGDVVADLSIENQLAAALFPAVPNSKSILNVGLSVATIVTHMPTLMRQVLLARAADMISNTMIHEMLSSLMLELPVAAIAASMLLSEESIHPTWNWPLCGDSISLPTFLIRTFMVNTDLSELTLGRLVNGTCTRIHISMAASVLVGAVAPPYKTIWKNSGLPSLPLRRVNFNGICTNKGSSIISSYESLGGCFSCSGDGLPWDSITTPIIKASSNAPCGAAAITMVEPDIDSPSDFERYFLWLSRDYFISVHQAFSFFQNVYYIRTATAFTAATVKCMLSIQDNSIDLSRRGIELAAALLTDLDYANDAMPCALFRNVIPDVLPTLGSYFACSSLACLAVIVLARRSFNSKDKHDNVRVAATALILNIAAAARQSPSSTSIFESFLITLFTNISALGGNIGSEVLPLPNTAANEFIVPLLQRAQRSDLLAALGDGGSEFKSEASRILFSWPVEGS